MKSLFWIALVCTAVFFVAGLYATEYHARFGGAFVYACINGFCGLVLSVVPWMIYKLLKIAYLKMVRIEAELTTKHVDVLERA